MPDTSSVVFSYLYLLARAEERGYVYLTHELREMIDSIIKQVKRDNVEQAVEALRSFKELLALLEPIIEKGRENTPAELLVKNVENNKVLLPIAKKSSTTASLHEWAIEDQRLIEANTAIDAMM
jgi:hypothetical protein